MVQDVLIDVSTCHYPTMQVRWQQVDYPTSARFTGQLLLIIPTLHSPFSLLRYWSSNCGTRANVYMQIIRYRLDVVLVGLFIYIFQRSNNGLLTWATSGDPLGHLKQGFPTLSLWRLTFCASQCEVVKWTVMICNDTILINKLTYTTEHRSCEANSISDSQELFPHFMEPEGSLPYSHKPTTGPYPEPAESISPHRSLSP
jgi:hypothetical protein